MASLLLAEELGDRASIAWTLIGAACLASDDGDESSAGRLLKVGTALRESLGERWLPTSGFSHALLNRAEFDAARNQRQRTLRHEIDIDAAIELARSVFSAAPSMETARAKLLTAREQEVLGLMAEGLGDKTIAVELGMSRRTASKHVATILAKLDVESRTAAVTRAMRQGLLAAPSDSA